MLGPAWSGAPPLASLEGGGTDCPLTSRGKVLVAASSGSRLRLLALRHIGPWNVTPALHVNRTEAPMPQQCIIIIIMIITIFILIIILEC
jgi:hypothetical protein